MERNLKLKNEFIEKYLHAYNCGITAKNLNASYGICSSNSLFGHIYAYHNETIIKKENVLIAKAVNNLLSYNCCITFHDPITVAEYNKLKSDKTKRIKTNQPNVYKLHDCDAVPIMVNSVLDQYIALHYEVDSELSIEIEDLLKLMSDVRIDPKLQARFGINNNPLFDHNTDRFDDVFKIPFNRNIRPKISGYFFINGDIVAIPYLMDNNRENIHLYKDRLSREYWRFFLYSKTNRGYKFYYDLSNDKFMSRDCHGVDFTEALPKINLQEEFDINDEYILWDKSWIKWLLTSFIPYKFEIDTLYNKLILSPINIIMRAIILMRKRPNEALNIIKTGNFARLLSSTTRFTIKTEKPFANFIRSVNNSNFLRHPNSNQIEDWQLLSQIVKPTQEQVKLNKKIPDNFNGFICPYDLNANIKNFAKYFSIVHDVQCNQPVEDNVLNNLIKSLLQYNLLQKQYSVDDDPTEIFKTVKPSLNTRPILINGTLPTPYTMNGKIKELYMAVKNINPWIEVRNLNGFVSLNCFAGMPMKPYKHYFISPYELNTFESEYMTSGHMSQIGLIGGFFIDSHKLASHDRSVGSAGYYKSSLTSQNNLLTCTLSNEVVSTYLSTDDKSLPHFLEDYDSSGKAIKHIQPLKIVEGNFIPLKVAFCGSLYTNEDGYSINEKLNFNVVITKKMNYDFTPAKEMQFILADPKNCAQYIYNAYSGEREELLVKICTIYTTDEIEPSHYTKLTCQKREDNIYDFYKTLDSRDILQLPSEKDITFNIEVRHSSLKVQILLQLLYRVPYYDGLKLCNLSAQKGLGTFHNLSQYQNDVGEQPDMLMSIFGIIGRSPLAQIQKMVNNSTEKSKLYFIDEAGQKTDVGWMSTCEFFLCKNNSSSISMVGLMKIDHLTNYCFVMNNLILTLYHKIQDQYDPADRFVPFPAENMKILELYALQKTHIQCLEDANQEIVEPIIKDVQQMLLDMDKNQYKPELFDRITKNISQLTTALTPISSPSPTSSSTSLPTSLPMLTSAEAPASPKSMPKFKILQPPSLTITEINENTPVAENTKLKTTALKRHAVKRTKNNSSVRNKLMKQNDSIAVMSQVEQNNPTQAAKLSQVDSELSDPISTYNRTQNSTVAEIFRIVDKLNAEKKTTKLPTIKPKAVKVLKKNP